MTVTYRPAPAVERIAQDLIRKHHHALDDVRIDYVFRSEAAKSNGKTVMGRARKISGLNAYLAAEEHDESGDDADDFFVIEVAEPVWAVLEKEQRVALVDHELCHCTTGRDKDGNVVLKMHPHDLEEFRSIVERHGLWQPDLEKFADVIQFRQLQIGDDD